MISMETGDISISFILHQQITIAELSILRVLDENLADISYEGQLSTEFVPIVQYVVALAKFVEVSSEENVVNGYHQNCTKTQNSGSQNTNHLFTLRYMTVFVTSDPMCCIALETCISYVIPLSATN